MANSGGGGGSAGAVRAGRAFVELLGDNSKLIRTLNLTKTKLLDLGKSTTKIGAGLFAGGGGAAAGLLAALKGVSSEVGGIGNVAAALGLSAEAASELFGVMKAAGSDLKDATEGLTTLGDRVNDALAGKGEEAKEFFDDLGVSAKEFQGLNSAEQFFKLHAALLKVEDPAKRVLLLLKGTGEDTGKNLINTLSMTTTELKAYSKQFTISGEEMAVARRANMEFARASAVLSNAWERVVIAVASVVPFERIGSVIGNVVRGVRDFAIANAAAVRTAALVAAGVAVAGAALVALGTGFTLAGLAAGGFAAAVGLAGTVLGAVFSPVGLAVAGVTAAVAGGLYLWTQYTTSGQAALTALATTSQWFGGIARQAFGGIAAALKAGDLQLAGKIAMAGLNVAWQMGVGALRVGWEGLLNSLQGTWSGFAGWVGDVWRAAVATVQDAGLTMASKLQSIWIDVGAGLRQVLASALGLLGTGIGRVIGKMVSDSLAVMEKGLRLVKATGAANTLATMRQSFDKARWNPGSVKAGIEQDRQDEQENLARETEIARKRLAEARQAEQAAIQAERQADKAIAEGREQAALDQAARRVAEAKGELDRLTAMQTAAKKPAVPDLAAVPPAVSQMAKEIRSGTAGGFGSLGSRFGVGESITKQMAKTADKQLDELKDVNKNLKDAPVVRFGP